MGKRTVQDATISDIQKRKFPSKHYVYVIHVSWSDGSVNVIYRRYSKFFDFQVKLLSLFPEEAGARNPTQRMIPFLPGKKLFGRSHTREVANKRLKQLNEYCKLLVRLPPKISECDEVIQFMTPTSEDINPPTDSNRKKFGTEIDSISDPIQPEQYVVIADYKKQQKNEVDLHAGDSVEVFEKNDNGWWFINSNDNQGWAPGTFLSKGDGTDDEEESMEGSDEHYITNNSYKGQQADEVSFETGVVLNVVQKTLDGWWKVSYQGKVGWVPAAFLQPYNGPSDITANAPTQRIGNVMNVSDIINKRKAAETGLKSVGTEAKPTPPRRCTVRGTVRKGATRGKRPPPKKKVQAYYTVADFASSAGDSISFQSGEQVQVVQESDSGWWLVKIGEEEGWAPSTYIEARDEPEAGTKPVRSSIQSLDEETGESKPPRPPPLSARKTSDATQGQSSLNTQRPVPIPKSTDNRSAFRPISNHGRPLPIVPAKKPLPYKRISSTPQNGGDSSEFLRAQANLKPVDGNAKKVPVKVTQLKNQLESMKTNDSQSQSSKAQGYITTGSYANEDEDEDGLSFEEGVNVEVIEENDSGWWLVRIDDVEGWAPSTYLEKL